MLANVCHTHTLAVENCTTTAQAVQVHHQQHVVENDSFRVTCTFHDSHVMDTSIAVCACVSGRTVDTWVSFFLAASGLILRKVLHLLLATRNWR